MVKSNRNKINDRSVIADIIIYAVVFLLSLLTFIPFLHTFNVSISSSQRVMENTIMLWPQDIGLDSFKVIFRNGALIKAFQITIFITVVGTALNLLLTATAAYALSKRDLPGRQGIMVFIIVTIIFNAGIIPEYMLYRTLNLIDSIWSLVIAGLVSGFNLILMRNFFMGIPEALIESAKMDGAREFRVLFQIIIPLSVPAIITVGLFYAVGHWNEFFRGIMFINDSAKWPLQVVLRGIVAQADFTQIGGSASSYVGKNVNVQTIQGAAIMTATLPILVVYPFLQKYFNKGMVLGAVKE